MGLLNLILNWFGYQVTKLPETRRIADSTLAEPSVEEVAEQVEDAILDEEFFGLYELLYTGGQDDVRRVLGVRGWYDLKVVKTDDGKSWSAKPLWLEGSWYRDDAGMLKRSSSSVPYAMVMTHRTEDPHKSVRLRRSEFIREYGIDPMGSILTRFRAAKARAEATQVAQDLN